VKIIDLETHEDMAEGDVIGGLYQIKLDKDVQHQALTSTGKRWHARMGHLHEKAMRKLVVDNVLPTSVACKDITSCDSCLKQKSHNIHKKDCTHSYLPLQLMFSDIWGPGPVESVNGFKFYINFVGAATNYNWVYPLKRKSEVTEVFLKFKPRVECQTGHKIRALQTDNAKEFKALTKVLDQFGIDHRFSCPYDHPQMGSVERHHKHHVDTALTMLHFAKMPTRFWDYAILTAARLYNQNPTWILQGVSSMKVLFDRNPEYDKLRILGCKCYPCLRHHRRNEVDEK